MKQKSFFNKKNYVGELKKLCLLNEYKTWYQGEAESILKYYKRGDYLKDKQANGRSDTALMTRGFYQLAPVGSQFNIAGGYQINSFSVLHRPLPKVICRTFAVLIAGQAPEVIAATKSKERTKAIQDKIDDILELNSFDSKLQLAAEYESYSGAVAFKPILSDDVDNPLFQIYPKDRFIINESFESILNSVVFIDYFNDDENETFTLLSEYGRGFIKYRLLDKSNKEVELSTIDELSDLQDIELYDSEGQLLDQVLAVVQKNRGTGESDYKDQIDNFQAVDEAFSIMINLIRKSQPKRVISEASLIHGQDENGTPIYRIPSSYDNDVIVMWDNKREGSQDEKNELQATPNLQNPITAYRETIDSALLDIASSVGLSSKTLSGIEEAGANASAEALGLRSNVDYRTRDLKIQSWKKSISDLIKLLLILSSLDGNSVTINLDELELTIKFYDPANFQAGTPTIQQKIETIKPAYDGGLIDLRGALDYIWSDTKSVEEIDQLYLILTTQPKLNTQEASEQGILSDEQDAEKEDEGIDEDDIIAELKRWGVDDDEIKSFLADLKEANDEKESDDEEESDDEKETDEEEKETDEKRSHKK